MSILMMMVSEQMPTTSDYVPLFGLFYLTIIIVIFVGTLFTAIILNIHLQKMYAQPVSPLISYVFFNKVASLLRMHPPTMLLELWEETGVQFGRSRRKRDKKKTTKPTEKSSHTELLLKSPAPPRRPPPPPPQPPLLRSSTLAAGGEDLLQRASPADEVTMLRSQTARNNWKRLARKASERHKKELVNGNSEAPPPRPTAQVQPKRLSFQPEEEEGAPPPLMQCLSALSTTENTLLESKLKRRYALEWEYLATVLDRLLLIVFSIVVFIVTFLMILIGEAMHLSYQLTSDAAQSQTP